MPDWVGEASLAALMLVAIGAFLRFLSGERTERKAQSDRCHEAHEKTMTSMEKVVERNSGVIDNNSRTIGANTQVLTKLNGRRKHE